MNRPRLAVALALLSLSAGAVAVACQDQRVHPFSAWTYDVDRDCLEQPTVIDVLDGPDDGPCIQLRCWESADHLYFVTDTACAGPLDFTDETKDMSGVCAQALKVYGRDAHGECPVDADGGFGGFSQ